MPDTSVILAVTVTFLLAGMVKGVIGLGLPTVSLALLTVAFDLPSAMALLLVPSFVTNLWQALAGAHTREVALRIWPFLLTATATVWVGAAALTRVDLALLTALLGVLLASYALLSLGGVRLAIPLRHESWAGLLIGSANGVLTGMTGSFVVPGVMFLQAIGLPRDRLIQAMGMLFTASTLALGVALQQADFITPEHGLLSAGAVLPALAGMVLGRRLRARLSEQRFRTVFFVALLALGAYIIAGALGRMS
ncbi:MAG: sulfite exporter TauE/SafE family protein [Burkholderiales bacterium]|nr:sulfite exporter TauE/SafE family protein [Burkholderiales bacterium]